MKKYNREQIESFKNLYKSLKAIKGVKAGEVAYTLNIAFSAYDIPPIHTKDDFIAVLEILEN